MKKVLIVDDKQENLYLLEVLLKSKHFDVLPARNGQEALAIAARETPDLIISDILMPGMDGFSFCRELKKDADLSRLPFIFYTATYTDEKDEAYALSLGADQFIRKPMQPDLFMERIDQTISQSKRMPRPQKPPIKNEEESFKLYSERLIKKLEKKMFDLEAEIEARKAAENQLRRARNDWEETFQAIANPALLLDPDFNIIHANRAAIKGLEASEKALVGKKCFEAYHRTDQPVESCPLKALLKSQNPESVETEIEALGGTFLLTCAPIKNENGQVEKIIHIAVDINDRKQAEDRLKESEARYRRLTDNAKDMIYRMSLPDGRYEFVSPASKALFGYSADEFYATPSLIKEVMHPNWTEFFEKEWEKLIKGDLSPTYEYQIVHKSGDIRWLHQRNTLVKDEHDQPIAIEGIVTDVSRRKKMEVELKQNEERFRQLVENIHEVFWMRDALDNRILYINPVFENIFGMPVQRMYQDPLAFMSAVVEADRQLVLKARVDQVRLGKETDIAYRILVRDDIRWIRSRDFPIRDEKGRVVRIAGVAEDVSAAHLARIKQKELEAQLIHTQKLEAIGSLAGGIAHDFNNILTSIIGFTELSLDDLEPGGNIHNNLSEVMSAGLRAKALIRQILTLSRRSDDEFRPVKVGSVAQEALKLIRASIPANIEILQNINSDSLVWAPPAMIHQVLMNLLTNAAHAVQRTGGTIDISLSDVVLEQHPAGKSIGFEPSTYLRIIVTDTGTGIPTEAMGKIFDPYYTTKATGEGTGLGLSITQGIVQDCGGHIQVDSIAGSGTTFTVYLPVTKRREAMAPKRPTIPTGTERILIVDDEPAIAELTAQMLQRLGYRVISRTSSIESLNLFRARPNDFDLVITDMTMPAMTGDQLAIELMQIRPDIPVIMCTGYSNIMSGRSAQAIGIRAFAHKPIVRADLARTVRRVLDEKNETPA